MGLDGAWLLENWLMQSAESQDVAGRSASVQIAHDTECSRNGPTMSVYIYTHICHYLLKMIMMQKQC